jgi:hypothetical protein
MSPKDNLGGPASQTWITGFCFLLILLVCLPENDNFLCDKLKETKLSQNELANCKCAETVACLWGRHSTGGREVCLPGARPLLPDSEKVALGHGPLQLHQCEDKPSGIKEKQQKWHCQHVLSPGHIMSWPGTMVSDYQPKYNAIPASWSRIHMTPQS